MEAGVMADVIYGPRPQGQSGSEFPFVAQARKPLRRNISSGHWVLRTRRELFNL